MHLTRLHVVPSLTFNKKSCLLTRTYHQLAHSVRKSPQRSDGKPFVPGSRKIVQLNAFYWSEYWDWRKRSNEVSEWRKTPKYVSANMLKSMTNVSGVLLGARVGSSRCIPHVVAFVLRIWKFSLPASPLLSAHQHVLSQALTSISWLYRHKSLLD